MEFILSMLIWVSWSFYLPILLVASDSLVHYTISYTDHVVQLFSQYSFLHASPLPELIADCVTWSTQVLAATSHSTHPFSKLFSCELALVLLFHNMERSCTWWKSEMNTVISSLIHRTCSLLLPLTSACPLLSSSSASCMPGWIKTYCPLRSGGRMPYTIRFFQLQGTCFGEPVFP